MICVVRMMVHQHIPEWLSLDGLRVKIQYPKMKKQCNGCYENHLRKDCSNVKLSWGNYVTKFKQNNPDIPDEFYGKWLKKINRDVPVCPTEKDFHLLKNQVEWDEMKTKMLSCGIEESKIKSMMEERFQNYDQAVKEFNKKQSGCDIDLN